MRSESTRAFGQPRLTKPTFGALVLVAAFGTFGWDAGERRWRPLVVPEGGRGRYCATHAGKRQTALPGAGSSPTIGLSIEGRSAPQGAGMAQTVTRQELEAKIGQPLGV